ncbi:Fic family protein [Leptospira wolffii]|uniref:Fic family protein n=1 Tax=Leptospira wolffii TaxID=409998 RepID=UPI001FEE10A9|nr:Fic family protein [Leptospira wolffii]
MTFAENRTILRQTELLPVTRYIYQIPTWPEFTWNEKAISAHLSSIRHKQGIFSGQMRSIGFEQQSDTRIRALQEEIVRSFAIEGESLDPEQVRSSIARHLGIESAAIPEEEREIDGIVEMALDATENHSHPLTEERLFSWHSALFPSGRSGLKKITVADWRKPGSDPMLVVSGKMGREVVHYEAPKAKSVPKEMKRFLTWFRQETEMDSILKSAVSHFWFLTIHPFEDGNGRIARAISDMLLTRSEEGLPKFYSMSSGIQKERKQYYEILEFSQKANLDITRWISWYLDCLGRSIQFAEETVELILKKSAFWHKYSGVSLNERQIKVLKWALEGTNDPLTSSKYAKLTHSSQDTASRDIQDLISKGILKKESAGGRSTHYSPLL